MVHGCSDGCSCVVGVSVYQILAAFSSLWAAVTLCTLYKRIVNVMKVYIERKNMQVELMRFRKKYLIYSHLLLRTEEFNATRVFTLG